MRLVTEPMRLLKKIAIGPTGGVSWSPLTNAKFLLAPKDQLRADVNARREDQHTVPL